MFLHGKFDYSHVIFFSYPRENHRISFLLSTYIPVCYYSIISEVYVTYTVLSTIFRFFLFNYLISNNSNIHTLLPINTRKNPASILRIWGSYMIKATKYLHVIFLSQTCFQILAIKKKCIEFISRSLHTCLVLFKFDYMLYTNSTIGNFCRVYTSSYVEHPHPHCT